MKEVVFCLSVVKRIQVRKKITNLITSVIYTLKILSLGRPILKLGKNKILSLGSPILKLVPKLEILSLGKPILKLGRFQVWAQHI